MLVPVRRTARPFVLLVACAALSACAVSTTGGTSAGGAAGGGMMGGGGSSSGGGMMGGAAARGPSSTCAVPTTLTTPVVTATASDMGMMARSDATAPLGARMTLDASPTTVRAGRVTLLLQNAGWRVHELVVLPLAEGQDVGSRASGADGKVDEADSVGEASADCAAGSGEGVASGSAGWVTLTLAPGRYELVCNLENHYADGMRVELDVAG
jgi:uncharacterized cupredoxin-like copper-binding protein